MTSMPLDRVPASIDGCLEACRRCEAVIAQVMKHDGFAPGPAWSVVGPHLRHCVEHFQLLLRGHPVGRVDYDARERDGRLEHDPQAMKEALQAISRELASLPPESLERPMVVVQSAASGRPPSASPSCLDRELVFLSGHTIHHIAIMALAAVAAEVALSPDLAVAFSTEAYRESPIAR